jgi:hypothetical protein
MHRILIYSLLASIFGCTTSSDNSDTITFAFDFADSTEQWTGGFADYPVGEEDFFNLDFNRSSLPVPLDTNLQALRISGDNRSDDLFMFIKRKVDGLTPLANYSLNLEIQLASDSPEDAFGIGGGPGTSVFLKAGATGIEPVPILTEEPGFEDGYFRMNIDRGNQSLGGDDMPVIGNIAHSNEEFEYTLIERNLNNFTVQASEKGELWLIIGTDSGFEGTTTLYYSEIRAELTEL